MKIVLTSDEVHEACQDYIIKRKLLGPINYDNLCTLFRNSEDCECWSWSGEVEGYIETPEQVKPDGNA
jgi:hypothetical protein